MSETINGLIAQYGYLFIAIFLFIESVGIPVPGESALITAAALAGAGKLSIAWVFVSAILGSTLGGMTGYWMGARGGQAVIARFGRLLHIDEKRLTSANLFFQKHGPSALIVGRYVAVVRSFLGIFAGISAMSRRRFALFNAIGAFIWSLTFSLVGYFFGRNLPTLMRQLGRVALVLAIVVAAVILLVVGWRWFSANGARLVITMQERWERFDTQPWAERLRRDHPTAYRLLLLNFVRGEYLAVHYVIGWVLAVAALVIFGGVTEDVVAGAPLTAADVALSSGLAGTASPVILGTFRITAGFGGPITVASFAALLAVGLLIRRNWLTLGATLGAYGGAIGLDIVLRQIVRRGELPHSPELLQSDLLSRLPSGHTVTAIVVFGLIAHLLVRRAPNGVARVTIVTAVLALLSAIVVGRLFVGLSYLSTESASVIAGIIWLAAAISGLELARFRRDAPAERSA
jgi:membrane protein DedA with SNARE-associated domain